MSEEATLQLPLLYNELTPLSHARHGDYGVVGARTFEFARKQTFVPITMDEFPQAQRDYPIVFTTRGQPVPVAIVGAQEGGSRYVEADGSWRKGTYVPGYLRRYPFLMVREKADTDRHVFCADLTSDLFEQDCEDEERRLFDGENPGKGATRAMEFCKAYEAAMARTRAAVAELKALDLIGESSVSLKTGEKTSRIDGFAVIDENKLRDLPTDKMAALAKRGVLGCVYAHLFSMGNFARMELL